jgi:hypothetical protein
MVDEWCANKIHGKLIHPTNSKEFPTYSNFTSDTFIEDLIFYKVGRDWNIFNTHLPTRLFTNRTALKVLLDLTATKIAEIKLKEMFFPQPGVLNYNPTVWLYGA